VGSNPAGKLFAPLKTIYSYPLSFAPSIIEKALRSGT